MYTTCSVHLEHPLSCYMYACRGMAYGIPILTRFSKLIYYVQNIIKYMGKLHCQTECPYTVKHPKLTKLSNSNTLSILLQMHEQP